MYKKDIDNTVLNIKLLITWYKYIIYSWEIDNTVEKGKVEYTVTFHSIAQYPWGCFIYLFTESPYRTSIHLIYCINLLIYYNILIL